MTAIMTRLEVTLDNASGPEESRAGDGYLLVPSNLPLKPYSVHIDHWSREVEDVLGTSGATGVVIRGWSDSTHDLSFLANFADHIEYLQLWDDDRIDRSVISTFHRLEKLLLHESIKGIDFSRLSRLRWCSIEGARGLEAVAAAPALQELRIVRSDVSDLAIFSPIRTLSCLSVDSIPLLSARSIKALPQLRELDLAQCRRLPSLEGIQHSRLERLSLDILPRLPSIAPLLELRTLRNLWISSCKKVADLECIGEMSWLEKLVLMTQPNIPTLTFLGGVTNLRDFRMSGMKVQDGNLGILLDLPHLQMVGLHPEMRYYSHTEAGLMTLLRARNQGPVHV